MKTLRHRRHSAWMLAAALLVPLAAQSLPAPWKELDAKSIPLVGARLIAPSKARYFVVAPGTFEAAFKRAAPIAGKAPPPTLRLPMPDGRELSFSVVQTEVMAPELAAKYPSIKTYAGSAANHPEITGRFQMDPRGFRAMIFTPEGRVFVDPFSIGDTRHYQVYYQHDLAPRAGVPDQLIREQKRGENSASSAPLNTPKRGASISSTLRTYRLALAATYQYSSFHDPLTTANPIPRKAVVLAEQVNVVNRVSGVYERELGLRLVLIANNDLIIFNTPAQPYPDASAPPGSPPPTGGVVSLAAATSMFAMNTAVIDAIIGSENYDIGHVATTGGGGVAGLGIVCQELLKGRGVTGLPEPVGDPYYIDYVAHEMGHQFGGNHTFNGTLGSCSGNGGAATAFEPGSGVTIMAYAGICGTDNIARNSIDVFHPISFDEIVEYTRNAEGASCGVLATIANKPPTADAGTGGFTIPKQTPFELTAGGCDPDNDTITYQWSEMDLGPAGPPNSGATNSGPIFREFLPTLSPTRVFPQPSDLLNNTQTLGEILPNPATTRAMKFRLTVRDNKVFPSSGGVASADLAFTVTGGAGPFLVTFPDTPQSFAGNQKITTTWDVAGTTAAPVSCPYVNIFVSSDGGLTFPTQLAVGVPNDGSQDVQLPNIDTTKARIKVKCANNVFFDLSNTNFTITKVATPTPPVVPPVNPPTAAAAVSDTGRFGGAFGLSLLLPLLLLGGGRRRGG